MRHSDTINDELDGIDFSDDPPYLNRISEKARNKIEKVSTSPEIDLKILMKAWRHFGCYAPSFSQFILDCEFQPHNQKD